MSKQRKYDVLFAAIAIVIVCLCMALVSGCKDKPEMKVGQVWQDEPTGDPFKDGPPVKRKIVALKNGYVQYRRIYDTYEGELWSIPEAVFRFGAKPIVAETVGGPQIMIVHEGSLRWIWDDTLADKGHLNYYSGNEWIALEELPEPNAPPMFGKGDLPAEFTDFFGIDNNARLNFVQTQAINKHGEIIREIAKRLLILEGADPNDVGFTSELGRAG